MMSSVELNHSGFPVTQAIRNALTPNDEDALEKTIAKIILAATYIFSGTFLIALSFDCTLLLAEILSESSKKSFSCLLEAGKDLKSSFDRLFNSTLEDSFQEQAKMISTIFFATYVGLTISLCATL